MGRGAAHALQVLVQGSKAEAIVSVTQPQVSAVMVLRNELGSSPSTVHCTDGEAA